MTSIHASSSPFMVDLRRVYRAEYSKSEVLKAEFVCAADYAAFKISESPALVKKMLENYEMISAEAARQRALRVDRLTG